MIHLLNDMPMHDSKKSRLRQTNQRMMEVGQIWGMTLPLKGDGHHNHTSCYPTIHHTKYVFACVYFCFAQSQVFRSKDLVEGLIKSYEYALNESSFSCLLVIKGSQSTQSSSKKAPKKDQCKGRLHLMPKLGFLT